MTETENLIETELISLSHDERRAFAKNLPLDNFFNHNREKTFATLGRISITRKKPLSFNLSPEKHQKILERARKEAQGEAWLPYDEGGLEPQDLLALAAQGSKESQTKLEESIRLWWKQRENSPLWQKPVSAKPLNFLIKYLQARVEKFALKIQTELDLNEEEARALLRTDRFSRHTVYTRDYAAIPGELKAIFQMVPQLVFSPRIEEQLQKFIQYAGREHIRIAPRGRGTWALGGALLTRGGVVLEMASFNKKIEVNPEEQTITVSASVDFQEAEEALAEHQLTLVARPSNKYANIAGFLSVGEPLKGGLGLNAFAYGHIINSVQAIRVIDGQGRLHHLTREHPDFKYFFGTNGRHGIITEVTLKAIPKPDDHYPIALTFNNQKEAFHFLIQLNKDFSAGKLSKRPVHVEYFSAPYLQEIEKIKASKNVLANLSAKDTVLLVFYEREDQEQFINYLSQKNGGTQARPDFARQLWDDRFSPMKLRKKGDLLTAEVILPLSEVHNYLKEVSHFAGKLGIKLLPVVYLLNSDEALVLPQFITDRRLRFQYYRHFSFVPVLAHRAIKRGGRPYGYGIWFAGLASRSLGKELLHDLKGAKQRFDPKSILNPGKIYEIRGRFFNLAAWLLLNRFSIKLLDRALQLHGHLNYWPKFKKVFLTTKTKPYRQEKGDALHRCIKCSACFICPLAQIWEKSGDPRLMKDAIYITPRFKMEFMQRHLYEGKKLTQEDVDRFVLCLRCGVAEREQVCPISDLLLEVDQENGSPCQKKLPTYDEFEERLRKEGYDVDGAIQRYMDILKTHPGVAYAMKEVLGSYRVPKAGDLVVLNPKTDFAIYRVEVDQDRCINCGKCGDEHTTSQRGFWDPRHPRKMVSLNDLLREMGGKIPRNWFQDEGGPIPANLKSQGKSNGKYVYFPALVPGDSGHQHCNGCLYCVIECPVDAIRVSINDYYVNLEGKDFTREDIRRINEEARTGGVPTSGTGSTGLFGGKGFDRYMFDFSVIVRPTRDGIREAIDIGVNLGRKPLFHVFEQRHADSWPRLKSHFHTIDLPTPILLELPVLKDRKNCSDIAGIFAHVTSQQGTLLFMNLLQFMENFESVHSCAGHIALRLLPEEIETVCTWLKTRESDNFKEAIGKIPVVEIAHDGSKFDQEVQRIRQIWGRKVVISHLVSCSAGIEPEIVAQRVENLTRQGAEIIHLKTQFNPDKGYYETADLLPVCYDHLLELGLHTQVTLIANGIKSPADLGIAMMLGASAVVVDRAAVVALNHEFPMLEKQGKSLPEVDYDFGVKRLNNLFQSWHKQIREVLGAFGVRDIRRTVGERGRLIDLRDRERKMRAIVEDTNLLQKAREVNEQKLAQDGDLARRASWKYSDLQKLLQPVPPPNANLLGARRSSLESMLEARGDRRWNADMLTATWLMASGQVPSHKVPQTGCDFGGGSFDNMSFAPVKLNGKTISLEQAVEEIDQKIRGGDSEILAQMNEISISAGVVNRHRRPDSPPLVNRFPIDAADMSLGSIGWKLTLARYLAGAVLQRYTGTGEGGYPLEKYERLARFFPSLSREELHWLTRQLERWVATQTATGYFGVTEDTIRRARKLVLKFAQGAKPGLGGHILGPKVTLQVEDLRGVIAGISVFSPFPFHDVYSIEDVTKMIEWLRTINPDAIITVKISTPVDVYHVALGLVTAGTDEIQIDATAGGTGAAPDIARNRIAMPLEFALADVHKFLVEQGVRNDVTIVASGGIRSAYDVAKAIILGADKVILGTQEIVAEQCNRCGNCEAPGGCQKGITTTVEQLEEQKDIILNAQWLINAQVAIAQHLMKMMHAWGINDIRQLRGRTDLIQNWGWEDQTYLKITEQKEKTRVLVNGWDSSREERKEVDACGVVSFACTRPVPVESIQTACQRMHNRGNGRGGGILGLGGMFDASLEDYYALQIITLVSEKERSQKMLEIANNYLHDFDIFDRDQNRFEVKRLTADNLDLFRNPRRQIHGRDITYEEAGLAVDPGDLYRFFVRVKKSALLKFARQVLEKCRISEQEKKILENGNPTDFLKNVSIKGKWVEYYVKYYDLLTDEYLNSIDENSRFWEDPAYKDLWRDLEDEFIYRRAFEINQKYYIDPQNHGASPEAFVASMMKDGGIWKLVGYAEQAADYWIIGDAEYVEIKDLNRILEKVLAKLADKKIKSEIQNMKSAIQTFRTHGHLDRWLMEFNNRIKFSVEERQLDLKILLNKNHTITIMVPRTGKHAVVIYKYGAHVWIGHQRFPTVFSPYSGGSHPFYGRVYEALIHNGDFANYVAMVRFWDQFGGAPQFRTDTEMAAKAYAILKQMGYPQPHLLEAIAPTSGIDMKRLREVNPELAADFEAIQKIHISGSADGPWFFIIGDQDPVSRDLKVVGITDTSVLRPSVFLWQESTNGRWASIGLVGSEEQACRSVMDSLHKMGILASPEPDAVQIVRGGSVELADEQIIQGGGSIIYNLQRKQPGQYQLKITDKFGNILNRKNGQLYSTRTPLLFDTPQVEEIAQLLFDLRGNLKFRQPHSIFNFVKERLHQWEYNTFRWLVEALGNYATTDKRRDLIIQALTLIKDNLSSINTGKGELRKKRSILTQIVTDELNNLFDKIDKITAGSNNRKFYRLTWHERKKLLPCKSVEHILVVDATGFPPEGHDSLARTLVEAYLQGWRKFIVYKITGQRYLGAGFGPGTRNLEIHLYGSPGQDIANSLMGGTVHVHANAQNDMAKIFHSGTVVVHGLAGNTGVYGAKGGDIFVRGDVGTRWVINSVSSPSGPGLRVVIIGSAMEYLAESLMGGMVLMMGLQWDEQGILRRKYLPFAGNSILAGASAGKVIIYDPDQRLDPAQYKDAEDIGFLARDWAAVYRNIQNQVTQKFKPAEWTNLMERWRVVTRLNFRTANWLTEQKEATLNEIIEIFKCCHPAPAEKSRWKQDADKLKQLVEEQLTGKEWHTMVRLLGHNMNGTPWRKGLELLERLRDWKEVTELLLKADSHFHLGLEIKNGWLYLPIDGQKTEIRREDFKVLRPVREE